MKIIDKQLLNRLSGEALRSSRLRTHYNLHQSMEESVQRFLNIMSPGTYVRPHRHHQPQRWELFVILSGKAVILTFDNNGIVTERIELEAGGDNLAAEIPPAIWHTVVALQPGTVLFEFKEGPYQKPTDKNFAIWAPQEGDPECAMLVKWFESATPGNTPYSDNSLPSHE